MDCFINNYFIYLKFSIWVSAYGATYFTFHWFQIRWHIVIKCFIFVVKMFSQLFGVRATTKLRWMCFVVWLYFREFFPQIATLYCRPNMLPTFPCVLIQLAMFVPWQRSCNHVRSYEICQRSGQHQVYHFGTQFSTKNQQYLWAVEFCRSNQECFFKI